MNRKERRAAASRDRKRHLPIVDDVDEIEADVRSAVAEHLIKGGRSPESALEVAATSARLADRLFGRIPTPKLGCAKGCSWCCYQGVAVTVPEVFWIITYLGRTLPQEQFDRVRARIIEMADKTRGLSTAQQFHPDLPCPLLENGECLAYEARPLSCRGMSSLSATACKNALMDPEERRKMAEENATPIPGFEPHFLVAAAIGRGEQFGLIDASLMGQAVDLTQGLRAALEAGPSSLQDWLDGKPIFDGAVIREEPPRWFQEQYMRTWIATKRFDEPN